MGITEANINVDNESYGIDKGRQGNTKKSKTAIIIRDDLAFKVCEDLAKQQVPEI
jgi:hypothetical protein